MKNITSLFCIPLSWVVVLSVLLGSFVSSAMPGDVHARSGVISVLSSGTGGTGPFGEYWHLDTIGAQQAWKLGADGHGVHVLVIDTGLDRVEATTVLSGQVLPSLAVNPLHMEVSCPDVPSDQQCVETVLNPKPNPNPYIDTVGHGSFVLCEIVCNGQAYGYYGVAPLAKAAIAKVFDGENATDLDIANAIKWGAIHRFPVISLSLGGSTDTHGVCDAVAYAAAHGSVVVAAAGNDGMYEYMYPGSCAGTIRVSATDRWNHLTSWSSYGPNLGIAAPGDFIFGISPMHPTLINCGGLCTWQGTSMATPIVAGAIADLMSLGLSGHQATEALYHGANWGGYMTKEKYGHGLINLPRSIAYAHSQGWFK